MGTKQSSMASSNEETNLVNQNDNYGAIDLEVRRKSSSSASSSSSSSSSDVDVRFRGMKGEDNKNVENEATESGTTSKINKLPPGMTREGNINFRGITRLAKAKYMVLSDATKGKQAWQQMQNIWNTKKPTIIISVIGGAKPFYLDPRIAASLKATILKASRLPEACIITGGAYSGVMKLVGEALKESISAFSLGISTWNDVLNLESVMNDNESQYVVGSPLSREGLYLDYQHTNFIIVEEKEAGTRGQCSFRVSLEQYMKREFEVPSVLLLVNGGFGTLDFLLKCVTKVACPIVVVKKSGRAADLVAFGLSNWKKIKEMKEQGKRHEDLFERMQFYLCDRDENDNEGGNDNIDKKEDDNDNIDMKKDGNHIYSLEKYYDKLVKCLEQTDLFTIAETGSENDIDTAVLDALLGEKSNRKICDKLKLTLLWERADYARAKILSAEPVVKDKILNHLMISALARGDHEYVRLLMDYGVNMHELLTVEKLEFLYGYQACQDNFVLSKVLKECIYKLKLDENIIETNKNKNAEDKSLPPTIFKWILNEKLCANFMANEILIFDVLKDNKSNVDEKKQKFKDPFWELFIWAVICNVPKMADFLWAFGRNQMAKALIASEIFRKMSTYEGKYIQATIFLNEFSNLYKQAAHDLLDELSATNEVDTVKLCTTKLHHVPTMTCLDIAAKTKQYQYVAHNSIQMILADVWMGQIETRKAKMIDYIKVFFSIVFPFLMATEDDEEEKAKGTNTADKKKTFGDYMKWLHMFYFHTPILTFILHFLGSILFLILYACLVLTATITVDKCFWEILLASYVIGHVVEELYQVTQYDTDSVKTKFQSWFSDEHNQFDMFNIIVFLVAWGLSFDVATLAYAHTMHSINCGFWILRSSTVLRVIPTIGLYLEMISEMLKQLMWFLLILGVTILAYGIASSSIMHPGRQKPIVYLHMFLRCWFTIYGEYFLDMDTGNNATTHLSTPRINSYDEYVLWVLMGIFLLITNILLLNIVIAAFNSTYSNIQERSAHISKYRIYDLVVDYSKRISTPPPLSLLHHLCLLVRWLCMCMWLCTTKFTITCKETKLRRPGEPGEVEQLRDLEYVCAIKLIKGTTKGTKVTQYLQDNYSPDEDLKNIESIMADKISAAIEKMEEKGRVTQIGEGVSEEVLEKIEAMIEEKMSSAMEKMEEMASVSQDVSKQIESMENKIFVAIDKMEERISRLGDRMDQVCQTQT